jgi:predicted  nucleic acid-binding Zn-ribbon protein
VPTYASLQELQKIDAEIDRAISRMEEFAPLLEALDAKAQRLEKKIERARTRLKVLRVAERRLELSADEKRGRLRMLRDRLLKVHNLRQEAAVRAEMDLLSRTVDGDELEALTYLDQIRKLEMEAEQLARDLAD